MHRHNTIIGREALILKILLIMYYLQFCCNEYISLCAVLLVQNVILSRNFCLRNWHTVAVTDNSLWSKIKPQVTSIVMI